MSRAGRSFFVFGYARGSALPILAVLVVILKANPLLILFTAVDALGALWTALELRRDRAAWSGGAR